MARTLDLKRYEETVFERLSRAGIDCSARKRMPSPFTGNSVFKLEGATQAFLKIYVNELRFHRETGSLKVLSECNFKGSPRLIHTDFFSAQTAEQSKGKDNELIGSVRFALFSAIEGLPLDEHFDKMTEKHKAALLADLGSFLRRMFEQSSSVCPQEFGEIDVSTNPEYRSSNWQDLVAKTADRSESVLSSFNNKKDRLLFEEARNYYIAGARADKRLEFKAGLAHRDVTPQNLIVQHNGHEWQIQGLVDFEQAILGPPGIDLAKFSCFFDLPASCKEALVDAFFQGDENGHEILSLHTGYLYFTTWFYLIEYPSYSEDEARLMKICKTGLSKLFS